MIEILEKIFGSGEHLDAAQMSARALVAFLTLLVLCRLTGMRAFGRKSSFDSVIVIMLGAVMSRAVVGASPVIPTFAACVVLCVLHRLVAMATATVPAIERLVKGRSQVMYRGGIFHLPRMRRAGISRADLEETVRRHAHDLTLTEVLEIRLESSGELSVILDKVGIERRYERRDDQRLAQAIH
jgi:uncharacterized membrane protein YcaP (DUF421 family)